MVIIKFIKISASIIQRRYNIPFKKQMEESKSWYSRNKCKSVLVPPNPILSLLQLKLYIIKIVYNKFQDMAAIIIHQK